MRSGSTEHPANLRSGVAVLQDHLRSNRSANNSQSLEIPSYILRDVEVVEPKLYIGGKLDPTLKRCLVSAFKGCVLYKDSNSLPIPSPCSFYIPLESDRFPDEIAEIITIFLPESLRYKSRNDRNELHWRG